MSTPNPPAWSIDRQGNTLVLSLRGLWTLQSSPPPLEAVTTALAAPGIEGLRFDTRSLDGWDSLLVSTLRVLQGRCADRQVPMETSALPSGVPALLALASSAPVEEPASTATAGLLQTWGLWLQQIWILTREPLAFAGEMLLSGLRLLRHRANMRWGDFWFFVQEAGPAALGIISLVSVLAGVILAYLGAVQLRQFGAQIYVANLVSIGMTREMGALMTAIIMAGRTSAAYAAQLGTMQANEEIDALKIMGINPVDFLALPRTLALLLALPLLTLYADVLGMLGGSLIASSMDISLVQYSTQTQASIDITEVFAGLFKSLVFAVLIAQAGCFWGMKSGRSSTAVGRATTAAVVSALVSIIIADSVINVLYDRLGI